jgi:hypothetical protein
MIVAPANGLGLCLWRGLSGEAILAGMSNDPLETIRRTLVAIQGQIATKDDLASLRAHMATKDDLASLRAQVMARIDRLQDALTAAP